MIHTIRLAVTAAAFALTCLTTAQGQPLENTKPLTAEGDLASQMVAGIDTFLLREIDRSIERRTELWDRDTTKGEEYRKSVAPNRERFKKIIGVVDSRIEFTDLELISTVRQRSGRVGLAREVEILAVRWPVLKGVYAEGLLLLPRGLQPALADCVAIPDADQTPEMLAGLVDCPEHVQFAKRLAENNCRVLVPAILSRGTKHSIAHGGRRKTNQPHREFLYRPAYELGRHVIGYEAQKVLAGVDWFVRQPRGGRSIGVFGYGEGGLLAMYSAASDTRIDVCCTSGYFDSRQDVWKEPIYRNVFALLHEFGDAEIASLIAPRGLVVEAAAVPKIDNVPPVRNDGGRPKGTAAPGMLVTPSADRVRKEFERAKGLIDGLALERKWDLVLSGDGAGPHASEKAMTAFLQTLIAPSTKLRPILDAPLAARKEFDTDSREKRLLGQMLEHTQALMRESEYVRAERFKIDRSSLAAYEKSIKSFREEFYNEVIGRFDTPLVKPNPRTRKLEDKNKDLPYTRYEVVLDVFPDVIANGILILPKGMKPGERRPVVVCQHGLEGRPIHVADPEVENRAYHQYACKLAERGFITYAPQNPYIFYDRFRTLQRKANPLKKTLFSIIVPQHQQTVRWLASLPHVDPKRIGFYGLSYGGKTAMRVPAIVQEYCLSICSADFNEWIWKNCSTRSRYSYVGTIEYEMFEFNLGHTFNYAEMAALIAPRPFMVERGHRDGVAPDERVAYEFAKVRRLYADLKIPARTTIEYFDGPHTINGVGTFEFLHEHLKWPKRE